ncbi:hypothetical protein TNCV_2781481 [Trichonephila clavipes]|nr:hypothetical protein TNCV_2781481 [Trichonephila clavipes]
MCNGVRDSWRIDLREISPVHHRWLLQSLVSRFIPTALPLSDGDIAHTVRESICVDGNAFTWKLYLSVRVSSDLCTIRKFD